MDATQMISDSILESDEEENEEENENERGRPMAKLCVLKNKHIPETELPLFLGDNVLGRDPNTCKVPLPSPSVSKQHATISISVCRRGRRHSEADVEALVWDLGSMNGTRKGRLKLTPNVRYALSGCDSLVVADIPCQYVSCAAGTEASREDLKTPESRTPGVKAKLPVASGEEGSDSSAGSEKCVDGSTEARVSLADLEEARETPVRASCLSFEQTPTQPQGTLVPESDLDSDGDREGRADGRRKAVVSDSDSYKSSPACSTFLSPTNKIVPESEDESPMTPSVSTSSRPHRHVSFSREETDRDVGRRRLKERKAPAIVDDSEGEEGGEDERAAPGGRKSTGSGQDLLVKQGIHVGLKEDNGLPVSTTALTDGIPAFDMDSDADVEGEERGVTPARPVTSYTNQQADQPSNAAQFHMDSDTDIDEDDEDASDKVPKSVPSLAETSSNVKPHPISVMQPEAITMDSDTDVDDDAGVSDAASKPVSLQSAHTADFGPSTQQKDFPPDSDTDVDECEGKEGGTIHTCSKTDETPTRLDIKPAGPEPDPAAPRCLCLDSDTDDEVGPAPRQSTISADSSPSMQSKHFHLDSDTDVEGENEKSVTVSACSKNDETPIRFDIKPIEPESAPAAPHSLHPDTDDEANPAQDMSEPPVTSAVTESGTTAGESANSAARPDSDTDVKDDSPLVKPFAPTTLSSAPAAAPEALQSDSDADMDVGESSMPPLDRVSIADLHVDSDTDVAVKEVDFGWVHEGQIPTLCKENTPGLLGPLLQNCSTPVQLSEELGHLDNQVNSSLDHFRDNLGDEDSVVAETQSFVLQTRDHQSDPPVDHTMDATQAFCLESSGDEKGGSFHLALSDISHLQGQAQALAMESTQAFVSVQAFRPHAGISKAGRTFSEENDSNLEATQVYGENKEHARCSVTSEKEGLVDLGLEATQTYTSEPYCDSEDETEEDERTNNATAETQLLDFATSSTLAFGETQPMSALEEGESLDEENPVSSVQQVKSRSRNQTKDTEEGHGEANQLQDRPLNEALSVAETQPMFVSDNEERDVENFIPHPQKREEKQLPLEDEQTQPLISSEMSSFETQPMVMDEDRKSDDEDSIPGLRKRKEKPLQNQDGENQPLTDFEATIETLPLETKTCLQPQRGNRGLFEVGTSGITGRGKRGTGAQLREKKEKANCSEPPKRQTKTKNKSLPMSQPRSGESEEVEEMLVQTKRARGKKSMKQQKDDEEDKESERHKHTENVCPMNEQEGRLREDEDVTEQTGKERWESNEREGQQEESRCQREDQENLERERKEKEEQERIQLENAELLRFELERATKERGRKEQEEKERADRTQKDEGNFDGERKLEVGKLERDRNEQEHQRLEIEAKEMTERERFMKEKQEREAKEKPIEDQQEKMEEANKFCKAPARGRRASRRTTAAPCTTELEKDSTLSTNDDVPARRTRSRSNSVDSERSATSVTSQESRGRGRGRGRGAKTTSEPSQTASARRSNRRRTYATEPTEQSRNDVSPQALLLRSNPNTPLSSDISSRGRGGRYERGRKTEAYSSPPINSERDQNSAPRPTARGKKSRKTEESSSKDPHENSEGKADAQQASTTRGRWRASVNDAEPDEEERSLNQEEGFPGEESLPPKKNVRGRGQKAEKSETAEAPATAAASDGDVAKEKGRGRKRELEANAEEGPSSSSKISKWQEKAQTTDVAEEDAKGEAEDVIPVQVQRRGRASTTQARKSTKDSNAEVQVKEEDVTTEEVAVERRGRGRPSAIEKKKKEDQETPTRSGVRKRQAPADSSPVAKTPRSSSASPAARGRSRAASQTYKVLFTGVVDEAGEKVLAHLGGSIAKGLADMNCLVTDKVRRTVKFLCAVAKGVPIVTTNWLEKSGKAGSFLSPDAFVVKDPEQENKFNFCLQESLKIASNQPLLQGYEIHVTKSVKPEPPQMKDILTCSGATFLSKMPSSSKPQTVVISCEEDLQLCGPALSASLPVVTAEFILTGVLQQKLDFQTYTLSAPTSKPQPAGGRGRGRKRT